MGTAAVARDRERVVEVDLANERIVLATMAKEPEARRRLAFELRPGEFGDERHQVLFRGLARLAKEGLAWSEDTLAELVKGEDFGGFAYLRALLEDYDPNVNLKYHIERLHLDAAKLDLLREDIPALAEAAEDPAASPEKLLSIVQSAKSRIERQGRRFITGGTEISQSYYEELRLRRIVGDVSEGFGFRILDSALVLGLSPRSPLSILAARPSVGKSTLLANLIRHRIREEKGIFVCGWEMFREDYLDMMVAQETGIPASVLVNAVGTLTDEQRYAVQVATDRYSDRDLFEFEENPFIHLEKPQSRWDTNERNLDHFEGTVAHASKTKRLIAVDVFAKMLHDRRPDSISEALVRIHQMGSAYGIHILLLHHLNRDAAQGRPTMEGLKGAGGLEEEADLIFALDRPMLRASPARRKKMTDHLDIHLLKQRRGPAPVCVRFRFDGSRYSLSDEVEVDLAMLEGDDGEEAL